MSKSREICCINSSSYRSLYTRLIVPILFALFSTNKRMNASFQIKQKIPHTNLNTMHLVWLKKPAMDCSCNHTQKSFRNLVKSNRSLILFTIFRFIWNQPDLRLVPNQSENSKCNLISVWFNNISVCAGTVNT